MAAGKGFWGKLGTSMKNVTPEQWKAGAIITDKFSGGATGYLGSTIAQSNISLDGTRTKNLNREPTNEVNATDTNKRGQSSIGGGKDELTHNFKSP